MLSNAGGVSAKCVLRLAPYKEGAGNDDFQSLAAHLYHVTTLGSGSDLAAKLDSSKHPSGSTQNVSL